MKFTKMHGCGNDYIYMDSFTENIPEGDKADFVKRISDRHFGIGSDGVIFIHPAKEADFEMEMYNADGSRAEMCGNGIRCVAKYVYDKGLTEQTDIRIVSMGAVKRLKMTVENGKVKTVRVNMGKPELAAHNIPVLGDGGSRSEESMIDVPIEAGGKEYRMTCVSVGNPHAVVFVEDVMHFPLETVGPLFEHHSRFPNRVNAEFVQVLDRHTIRMRVWERGSGETLACGTGCCAAVTACILNGLTESHVTVKLLGGELDIEWDREADVLYMTGPAETVFEGEMD